MKKEILTKDQAIEKLLEIIAVSEWDYDSLVRAVEESFLEIYYKMNEKQLTKELQREWEMKMGGIDDDNLCPYYVDSSPTAQTLFGEHE